MKCYNLIQLVEVSVTRNVTASYSLWRSVSHEMLQPYTARGGQCHMKCYSLIQLVEVSVTRNVTTLYSLWRSVSHEMLQPHTAC